jgi:hypothetical protein
MKRRRPWAGHSYPLWRAQWALCGGGMVWHEWCRSLEAQPCNDQCAVQDPGAELELPGVARRVRKGAPFALLTD